MANKTLNQHQPLVDPSTLNWQKEADITWLYGPLFIESKMVETPTTLKSALQKNFNYSRFWSKCVSDPGNNKIVRFNPNVTQINYLPETPVKESLVINDDSEGDEEEEDEELAIAMNKFNFSSKDVIENQSNKQNATPSTNKIILDYLLYLSIQSRLKQASVELLELSFPLPKERETLEERKKRWIESAAKAEQDKHAVEAIVAGILSSHCNKTLSFKRDCHFEQRLHLCQLTNLVFGRFDIASTHQETSSSTPLTHRPWRRYLSPEPLNREELFSEPIQPAFCRRHRVQDCYGCNLPTISKPAPGLIEAIPTFLRTSADMLRRRLESGEEVKPMMFAGQKVMGGGMPPKWYDLFLELLTQAAIESYLCDGQVGLESIFEIFSYGRVEEEGEEEEAEEEEEEEEEDEEEEGEQQEVGSWGVRAADHHLLFPKTRTMYLFKTQVREREKDFLNVNEQGNFQAHFEKLAQRFPLERFERNMGDFIHMILDTMDMPALDDTNTQTGEKASDPSVYKYPGDGSLLMPEIPDEETENGKKRAAEDEMISSDNNKRKKE
ncbi:hypothetical protein G6F59_009226 [Rhizopus arrhizus]|nr:hypothetical protein G6F39_010690 [Rhizopus arrhizus]KAG1416564.1 hypothetical protein G6F59_009226 [Rhizopus arrhizus]